MAADAGLFVSPKQIQEWKDQIADLQKKVEAGEYLLGTVKKMGFQPLPEPLAEMSFMGSIVQIVKDSPKPISRPEIRDKLEGMGFSKEKIAKQFNTVLYKTMQAERIIYASDGKRLEKGPKA